MAAMQGRPSARTISFLVACFLLFLTVAATPVHYCDKQADYAVKVREVVIKPDPVVRGKPATFSISAVTKDDIAGGKLVIDVKYFGVHIHQETHDLCDETSCPVSGGDFVISHKQVLPGFTPPSLSLHVVCPLHCAEDTDEVAFSGAIGVWVCLPCCCCHPPCFLVSSFYKNTHCLVSNLLSTKFQLMPWPGYLLQHYMLTHHFLCLCCWTEGAWVSWLGSIPGLSWREAYGSKMGVRPMVEGLKVKSANGQWEKRKKLLFHAMTKEGSYTLTMKLLGEGAEQLTCVSFDFKIKVGSPLADS
ncbi:hypothetical protein Taro_024292 [Colocasia esculenta]|uniref:MD-2-related lipid-recognition domain-containing protein n=1 Tax=Colocasia esculenta TaxID=4460 RepID=A0A843V714_COLES|nr:hypothetical protein [Colocasia esculenta]